MRYQFSKKRTNFSLPHHRLVDSSLYQFLPRFQMVKEINLPILKSDALVAEKSECCEEAELEDEIPEWDACKNNCQKRRTRSHEHTHKASLNHV
jgi:hypothetical protein